MICSSVNRARFICPSLFQGRTLNPRGGKSQWQVSSCKALSLRFCSCPRCARRPPKQPMGAAPGSAAAAERTFNLLPPNIADIGEIVRAPAQAAGLEWQTDPKSGQRLDDQIIADVDRPDLLPLLQFVLQQLFEQRETIDGAATLTWSAYSRIGSLDGAINTAGNRAIGGLGADLAALPKLLRALVAFPVASGALADPPPILRQAAVDKAASNEASRNLIKALTDARIL